MINTPKVVSQRGLSVEKASQRFGILRLNLKQAEESLPSLIYSSTMPRTQSIHPLRIRERVCGTSYLPVEDILRHHD